MAWSKVAIERNRRKRMARRLFKKQPLFALQEMQKIYGEKYTMEVFLQDQIKTSKYKKFRGAKPKKKNGKWELLQLLKKKIEKGEHQYITQYNLVLNNYKNDWCLSVRLEGQQIEYFFNKRVPYTFIKKIGQMANTVKTHQEFKDKRDQILKMARWF